MFESALNSREDSNVYMTLLPPGRVLTCLVDVHRINSRNCGKEVLPPRASDPGTGGPLQEGYKSSIWGLPAWTLLLLHCSCIWCLSLHAQFWRCLRWNEDVQDESIYSHLLKKKLWFRKIRQEEKGTTEDEMVGWHHRLHGHEFE